MNNLAQSGAIQVMDCGTCFSYILSENGWFLTTEYKVLQSQSGSGFVKCMRMLFNGKVQLYYMPGNLKPLSQLLPVLSPNKFLRIVLNLLNSVLAVKNNGFLTCQNLDISVDKIFVDQATSAVSLVYMPLYRKNYSDYAEFENELKAGLIRLVESNDHLKSGKTAQFCEFAEDANISIEKLCSIIGGRDTVDEDGGEEIKTDSGLILRALNASPVFELKIDKDEVSIGKHPKLVDAVIPFNKAISRRHCRIFKEGGHYYIEDLASSNHTYHNKRRLTPHMPSMLAHGDVVRLADSDFSVEMM